MKDVSLLLGKRVLFISVKFFNYETLIKKQLEEMGAIVDMYDERPSNSFYSKAIIRLRKDIYRSRINQYFEGIIQAIRDKKYDFFLLIKGEATPDFFIDFLKTNNPKIKLIYYTFDSFVNNSNGLRLLEKFDLKYTFDSEDSKKYNLKFRPLFYAPEYRELYESNTSFKNDLAFIGTAHSDRYTISERLRKWCNRFDLIMFAYYFSPSRILFWYKKVIDKNNRMISDKEISFISLSHNEIIDIYSNSKVILDINHPGQNGLTMRTFEALGAGRKLITTNSNIRNYPFYDERNILVIDRSTEDLDVTFFNTDFTKIQLELLEAMSLRGWVEEVFQLNNYNPWSQVILSDS